MSLRPIGLFFGALLALVGALVGAAGISVFAMLAVRRRDFPATAPVASREAIQGPSPMPSAPAESTLH
jgi:hypothetical protein